MVNRVYINGRITTMVASLGECHALAIRGDRVAYAGSRAGAEGALAGETYRVIDLGGRRVLPGFIDAHAHLSLFSIEWGNLRLKPMKSLNQILEAVKAEATRRPRGTWIRGSGYNQTTLLEGRHPTRQELDRMAPHHPVLLTRTCGHIAAANTMALNVAGIALQAPDPSGGRFDRDPDGTINGVVYDQALAGLQKASVPHDDELLTWIKEATRVWAAAGLTGVHDAGGVPGYFRILARAFREGRIPQRIDAMVWNGLGVDQLSEFLGSHISTGFHRNDFYVGAAKIMMDGSSSGPTAATRDPYASNPGFSGILYRDEEALRHWIGAAVQEGFQVTAHAVGDRAVAMAANVIGELGDPTMRNRIEHCAMCPPDVQEVLVRHQIAPVAQPGFLYEFGDGYVQSYGFQRGSHMFPLKSWLDQGLPVAGSSDSPVTDYRPLSGIASAVSRMTRSGMVLAAEERVTMKEALKLYTVNPAWLTFSEEERGRLAAGLRADFVVLAEDILSMDDAADIRESTVAMTVIRGEPAWVDPSHGDWMGV